MMCRNFKPTDMELYSTWCKNRNVEHILGMKLPDYGLIVDDIASAFLVETNSDFCIMEYLVSNPESSKEQRQEAIDLMIKDFEQYALKKGYKRIINILQHPQVGIKLAKNKYQLFSANAYVFIKELQ